MFGWSMFFGLLGVIVFLVAGGSFMGHFLTRKKDQQKGEEKRPIPYLLILSIASGVGGFVLFGVSYYWFYRHFAGKITTPNRLNPAMIYRVGGQATIEEQNAAFLGDATTKGVWCVKSEPINPNVRFVRAVKTPPPESKWILEPLDLDIPKK